MANESPLTIVFEQNGQKIAISEDKVTEMFHHIYYGKRESIWKNTSFLGHSVWKCPLDLWVYQEIIFELQPDVIIETGTHYGGSTFYYASLCDLIGKGKVVTIDIFNRPTLPKHERIIYILGSSTDDDTVSQVQELVNGVETVLVILDSDHTMDHVSQELAIYSDFVSPGSYLIVEDTNVNGHPVMMEHGAGPYEAVQSFLESDTRFVQDMEKEKFMMTFNPSGFLKKIS